MHLMQTSHPESDAPSVSKARLWQRIQGALNRVNALFHHMGVDLRGFHVRMSHELLDHPDIHPVFQQVRGERVPKRMTTHRFGDSRPAYGSLYRLLKAGFQHMVPTGPARPGINTQFLCGKHILPAQRFGGTLLFTGNGVGQIDFAESFRQIPLVQFFNPFYLNLKEGMK